MTRKPRPAPATRPGSDSGKPFEQIASAGRLLFVGSLGGKAMKLAHDLMLGRVLGVAGFGIVSSCSSFVIILVELGLLGMHRSVLRFASVHESRGESRSASAISRKGVIVPAVAGLGLFLAVLLARAPLTRLLFGDHVSEWILPTFAAAIPILGVTLIRQFAARAGKRFAVDLLIGEIGRAGFPLLVTALLFLWGWQLWGAALGTLIGAIATLVVALVWRGRKGSDGDPAAPATTPELTRLIRVALPLALAGSSILLINELDKVMLAIFRPESEVGLYNAAFRISRQANLFLPALTGAISPWVAPLLADGKTEELLRLYRQTTRWSVAVGATIFAVLVLFAPELVGWFGGDFAGGASLLIVLAVGQLVIATAGSSAMILQFSGREKSELENGLIGCGVNVALNLVLIPTYGSMGAAVATAFSLSLINVRRLIQVRALLGALPYDRTTVFALPTILLGGVGAALFGFAARFWDAPDALVPLAALVGAGVGWGLRLLVAPLHREDAALLRRRAVSSSRERDPSRESPPPSPPPEPEARAATADLPARAREPVSTPGSRRTAS